MRRTEKFHATCTYGCTTKRPGISLIFRGISTVTCSSISVSVLFSDPTVHRPLFSLLSRYPPPFGFVPNVQPPGSSFLPTFTRPAHLSSRHVHRISDYQQRQLGDIPTGDPAAKRGCPSLPRCRQPSCALIGDAGVLPSPVSRFPSPASHLASCWQRQLLPTRTRKAPQRQVSISQTIRPCQSLSIRHYLTGPTTGGIQSVVRHLSVSAPIHPLTHPPHSKKQQTTPPPSPRGGAEGALIQSSLAAILLRFGYCATNR